MESVKKWRLQLVIAPAISTILLKRWFYAWHAKKTIILVEVELYAKQGLGAILVPVNVLTANQIITCLLIKYVREL